MTDRAQNLHFIKGLIEALRPKTLTASVIPVILGTALSGLAFAEIDLYLAFSLLLTALFIQTGTNLVNDALDFQKKADTDERLGPKRLIQRGLCTPRQVLLAGAVAFGLAWFTAQPMIARGGYPFDLILTLSICLGYLYTGGPYPLAYKGLGELFVILFFGLVLTGSAAYLQTLSLSWPPLVAGLQIGLFSTALIAINNLRDIEQDKKADKRTLAARFGIKFGKAEIATVLILPYLIGLYWLQSQGVLFLLPYLTLPLALNLIRNIYAHAPSQIYNRFLQEAALIHLCFGLLLTLGVALS